MEPIRRHIIKVEENQKDYLAWVEDEVKGGKVKIRLRNGREKKIPLRSIQLVLPNPVDSWKKIIEVERLSKAIEDDIDLESLWELALEMGEFVTLQDLGELLFESFNNARLLALYNALSKDRLYFKPRKDGYEPRPSENVHQILMQIAALEKKEREIREFINKLTEIFNCNDCEEKINEIKGLSWTRRYIDYILRLAVHGKENAKEDAVKIIKSITMPQGKRFKSLERRAFEVLVKLGELDEHANLRLLRLGVKKGFTQEIEELASSLNPSMEGREDFRELLVFTIDDPWTMDLDDALSVQEVEKGFEVGIHIADPASVLYPGHPIDLIARERATTIYLPEGNIPMMPRSLSEGRLSLEQGQDRPALSFLVTIDNNGNILDFKIVPSIIRSKARLDYDSVTKDLKSQILPDDIHDSLIMLFNIHKMLEDKRKGNGAISINLPDVKVKLLDDGHIIVHTIDTNSPARMLVAEFMILCNMVAGRFARKHGLPVIYRIQSKPEDIPGAPDPNTIIGAFEILSKMKKGEFSTKPASHHGLGVDVYLQVSSPLRRYADLLAHYQLKSFIDGKEPPFTQDEVFPILGTSDTMAYEASLLEKESNRYWLMVYFQENIGRLRIKGTVLDIRDQRKRRGVIFLNDFGFKVNVSFDHPVEIGDVLEFVIKKVDPRGDLLFLEHITNH